MPVLQAGKFIKEKEKISQLKEVGNMKKKNNKIKYNKFKDLLSNQKGVALVTVLIFTFLMLTFVVALMAMTSNDIKLSSMQRDTTKALYQADGGIEKTIWYLNSSEDNPDGLNFYGHLQGGTATEFYDVEISDIDLGPPEIKTLTSTGTIEGGGKYVQDRVVEVKLIKRITPVPGLTYDKAIFTDEDMEFHGGISISGNIHSNGDLYVSSGEAFNLENGEATASGTNDYGDGNVHPEEFPQIDWPYFQDLAKREVDGGFYYDADPDIPGDNTVIFNDPKYLTGVHYVDGNVIVKTDLILENATIAAFGTIDILGNGSITLVNVLTDHPLALVAKGDIINGGSIHGEGVIQTEGGFTNNGVVDINEGAIYADTGVFNGGGGVAFNVCYATDLISVFVPGTGIPIWQKISWREIY
jgi:hypothetical protein